MAAFTLVEVMIALVILTGAAVAAVQLVSANATRVQKSRIHTLAALLLERKMIEVVEEYGQKSLAEIKDEDAGKFEDEPEFRWEFKSKNFEMPDVRQAIIAKDDGANEYVLTLFGILKDHIDQSVKEASVTVFGTLNGKEIKYTASTYFVDYSKPLALPGAGL